MTDLPARLWNPDEPPTVRFDPSLFVPAPPVPPFYHCSPQAFPDGYLLTSPAARGVLPRYETAANAMREGHQLRGYDPEAVYILTHQTEDWRTIIGYWIFGHDPVYLYRVEPNGAVWPDPENTPWCWCCSTATVVECLHRPGEPPQ